jgi:hypothetical protein
MQLTNEKYLQLLGQKEIQIQALQLRIQELEQQITSYEEQLKEKPNE